MRSKQARGPQLGLQVLGAAQLPAGACSAARRLLGGVASMTCSASHAAARGGCTCPRGSCAGACLRQACLLAPLVTLACPAASLARQAFASIWTTLRRCAIVKDSVVQSSGFRALAASEPSIPVDCGMLFLDR